MKNSNTFTQGPIFLAALLLFSPFMQTQPSFAGTDLPSKSLYQAKVQFEDQLGKKFTLVDLKGNPTVVAMLYTGCQTSCPLTMADLKAIEKKLTPDEKAKVKFAVFSFDSENDTPKSLNEFSKKQNVDLSRWSFFHGSPKNVRELAALLGIRFKKLGAGDYDHSNVISILDQEGVTVHQQVGVRQNPEESVQTLKKLIAGK